MLGADVIKIESVQRPDGMRFAGGFRADVERWWSTAGCSTASTPARSRSPWISSPTPAENFSAVWWPMPTWWSRTSPRVMENFGLRLRRAQGVQREDHRGPHARIRAGWAMARPRRLRDDHGATRRAGLDHRLPRRLPTAPRGACDPLAGVHAAFLTVAALEHRGRTGLGQLVEVPMIDVVLNASALQVIERDVAGITLTRRGNRGHEFAVQNVYACAGEEQWIAVSVRHNDDWQALKTVLGQPELGCCPGLLDRVRGHHRRPSRPVVRRPAAERNRRNPPWPPEFPLPRWCNRRTSSTTRSAGPRLLPDRRTPAVRAAALPRPPMTGDFVRSPAPLLGQHNGGSSAALWV